MSVRNPRSLRHRSLDLGSAALLAGLSGAATVSAANRPAEAESVTLRLGYFPNVTHAPAIVGVDSGAFTAALGDDVVLETSNFNAGGEAIEALLSGAIDATFIGQNAPLNGITQEDGQAVGPEGVA